MSGDKKKSAKILRDAARYIKEHGLQKGELEGPNGQLCVLQTICKVSGYFIAQEAMTALRKAIAHDYDDDTHPADLIVYTGISSWSDSLDSNPEPAIEKLLEAATLLDGQDIRLK